jgi:hypothetical protein
MLACPHPPPCAVLCALASGDSVLADRKIEQYKEMDYTLSGSRECKLAEDIARSFSEFNADEFTDTVYAYDQVCGGVSPQPPGCLWGGG